MNTVARLAAIVVFAGVAPSLLNPAPVQGVVISYAGSFYDISVIATTYADSSSLFQSLPNGSMPWWGSQATADFFAGQVFDSLGEGSTTGYGPLFASDFNASTSEVTGTLQDLSAAGSVIDGTFDAGVSVKFAIARTSVPGPLPLLGAAAAFGCSRQARRRWVKR